MSTANAQSGRYGEVDLYNQPGGYVRSMDSNAVGQPCPFGSQQIEKVQYWAPATPVQPIKKWLHQCVRKG